jgi:hypothetical protein
MMIAMNRFDVRPAGLAGNTGSGHAAHAAVGQRKRPIAVATDASVDQGST